MSEESIKKAEESKEAAELSDDELDGAAGGGVFGSFIRDYHAYQEKERKTAEALAEMQCPACGRKGARWLENYKFVCKSCNYVIYDG